MFVFVFSINTQKNNLTFNSNSENYTVQKDTTLAQSIKRGSAVYEEFCMQCHLETGLGVAGTFPPLAKADYLMQNREAAIKAVKFGLKGKIKVNGNTYNNIMAPLGLYDDEVADVMNYILNTWGNKSKEIVTEESVSKVKK